MSKLTIKEWMIVLFIVNMMVDGVIQFYVFLINAVVNKLLYESELVRFLKDKAP